MVWVKQLGRIWVAVGAGCGDGGASLMAVEVVVVNQH